MFQDLAQIVDLQEPAVQQTEQNAIQTQEDVNNGVIEINKAKEHAARARRLKWWCFFIVVRKQPKPSRNSRTYTDEY